MPSPYFSFHTCEVCGAKVKIHIRSGKALAHNEPGQLSLCTTSGEVICEPVRPTPQKPDRTQQERESTRMRIPSPGVYRGVSFAAPSFMASPRWFPEWDGEVLPSVALPARGRMAVWMPKRTYTNHEDFIRTYLGDGVQPKWEDSLGCWTVAKRHFITLAQALLRRYPRIAVGREYDSDEACNARCRNARGPLCTCSCKARNHGHGKWMDGWRITGETTQVVESREWSWIAVESDGLRRGSQELDVL